MGMAASQARFLGLTARMNNIEFEGQQINQQRTALSNKSASYYSDLLGMAVPTAPSVEEYTQTVYTFNDGALTNQITSLIADTANPGKYNVSYIKSWTDDFSIVSASPSIITNVGGGTYNIGGTKLRLLGQVGGGTTVGNSISINGETYAVNNDAGGYYINENVKTKGLQKCTAAEIANLEYYKFNSDYTSAEQLYKEADGSYYTLDDAGNKVPQTGVNENDLIMCLYDDTATNPDDAVILVQKDTDGGYSKEAEIVTPTKKYLTTAQVNSITIYNDAANDPYLKTLSTDQVTKLIAEEQEILKKLNNDLNNGDQTGQWFVRYVQNTSTGEYEGVYYKASEVTGATWDSKNNSQSFIGAYKLGSADRVEEIKGIGGCELEQDSTGRYINITFNDNGSKKTYALSTNTITDQDAYEDAMNQYEYDKALYDQSIEEINAKIEIIQAEDKNLELRLKQLDTEHNAISNEKDAVSKVIEKAVENGFKTFG